MEHINREDMLELTRRMTLSRNCFGRVAGGYYNEDGFLENSFNTHFRKLSPSEQNRLLAIAKAIPYSKTNESIRFHRFTDQEKKSGAYRAFWTLNQCELKNDALLESVYEALEDRIVCDTSAAVYFFQGCYDIPVKGTDKKEQWESEEVYKFIICAVCPINDDYVPGEPLEGFLFPAFDQRSSNENGIDIFVANGGDSEEGLLYLFWDD